MKKNILLTSVFLFATSLIFCQEFKAPPEGKCLVYFVRSSGTGALVNFKYFDGEKYLGKTNGVNYFVYECDPGEHILWCASENRDYVKGDLLANSTYVIEVRPTMGAMKAAVRLHPMNPDNPKSLNKVKKARKLLARKDPAVLKGKSDDMSFFIENGMVRYEQIENDVKVIGSNWTFDLEE